MNKLENVVFWLMFIIAVALLIGFGTYYNKYQIELDHYCPAYKILPCDCDDVVCLDCPDEGIVYVPQYITPQDDIEKMRLQGVMIETQEATIKTLNEFMRAQQSIINELR